jgi:branched-chain amino acid transport system permease protein
MTNFLAILIDGGIYASWLFLVAAGLTVIYGVMRVLNMAHGSLYAFGAYSAASVVGWYFSGEHGDPYWSYLLLIVCALVAGAIVGIVIEQGLLRFLIGRDEILMVIVTYALLLIFEDATKLIWGVDPYFAWQPYRLLGQTAVGGGLQFSNYDLALIAVSILVGLLPGSYSTEPTRDACCAPSFTTGRSRSPWASTLMPCLPPPCDRFGAGGLGRRADCTAISVTPGIGVEVIVLSLCRGRCRRPRQHRPAQLLAPYWSGCRVHSRSMLLRRSSYSSSTA